jgi:hypothetical protein
MSHSWKLPGLELEARSMVLKSSCVLSILPSVYGAFALGGQCQGTGVWGLCIPCVPTVPHLGRKNEPHTS